MLEKIAYSHDIDVMLVTFCGVERSEAFKVVIYCDTRRLVPKLGIFELSIEQGERDGSYKTFVVFGA